MVGHLEDSFGRLVREGIVLAFPAEWYLTCLDPRCHTLELVDVVPTRGSRQLVKYLDLALNHRMTDIDAAADGLGMLANRLVVLVKAVGDIAVETAAIVLDMHHSSEEKVSQHQVFEDHH